MPGKPGESELIRRVSSDDADEVMPPPATKNPLSAAERETLSRWIAEGAEYQPHWAFVAPVQAAIAGRGPCRLAAQRDRPFCLGPAGA